MGHSQLHRSQFCKFLTDNGMVYELAMSITEAVHRPISDLFDMTDEDILEKLKSGGMFMTNEVNELMKIVYEHRAKVFMSRPQSKHEAMKSYWMARSVEYDVAACIARALDLWPTDLEQHSDADIRTRLAVEPNFKQNGENYSMVETVVKTLHDEDKYRFYFEYSQQETVTHEQLYAFLEKLYDLPPDFEMTPPVRKRHHV